MTKERKLKDDLAELIRRLDRLSEQLVAAQGRHGIDMDEEVDTVLLVANRLKRERLAELERVGVR